MMVNEPWGSARTGRPAGGSSPKRLPLCWLALSLCSFGCDARAAKAPSSLDAATQTDSRESAPADAVPTASQPPEATGSGSTPADVPPGQWEALCTAASHANFPVADLPPKGDKGEAKSGESYRHYYGIATPVDYAAARRAAFQERERGDSLVFGGSAILMMLYGNGLGVKRDLDLAIKLACATGHAPAEFEGRVMHLNGMRAAAADRLFDFCDDVTSGYMMGHCANLAEERQNAQREHELAKLVTKWPPEHLRTLETLKGALEKYASARAGQENDLSGADRGLVISETLGAMRQGLLEALQSYEQGKLPEHSDEDYRRADAELNRTYKATLSKPQPYTTITAAGIKTTERAWIGYRDAWVALAAQRYPGLSPIAIKTWLTLQRIEQLRNI
jgi:uncharacterized protein YecT (DUF1311 family)